MKKSILALCAVVGLGACGGLDIPDLDNPSLDEYRDKPTRAAVLSGATGLLIGHRTGMAAQIGYVAELAVIGREAYIFDGADPRYVAELLGPALDPGGPAFGGNFWVNPYANIRNANTLLDALEKVSNVTDAEKEAIRGFAKTIQALDLLVVINTRDTNGAVIDTNRPVDAAPAPIVGKDQVLAHIATLLDEAKTHLQNGGTDFPFAVSTGFESESRDPNDGFDTPARFLRFNRAVKARVSVYRGSPTNTAPYQEALTALSESFLDTTKPLTMGTYNTYGEGSGETRSELDSANIYAHPSIVTDAETQQGSALLDRRVLAKVEKAQDPGSAADGRLASEWAFIMYEDASAKLPIIRNEELILLRAEANIGLGQIPQAADDINFIRVNSGGLAPRGDITADTALDELLKQKRYSLMFEGGHRWIDLRRYDKLDTLPRELDPNVAPHERFPIPAAEMNARQ